MATITGQDSYGLLDMSMAGQGGAVQGPSDLGFFGGTGFAKIKPNTRRDAYGRKAKETIEENEDVLSASEYLRQRAQSSLNVSTGQRRPVTRPPPPPEVIPDKEVMSQSDYYKKKYGAFYNQETVWVTPAKPAANAPTSEIVGTDRATQGDVELLQRAVDTELLRLQNLRSTAADMMARVNALDFLSSDLNDLLGQIRRNEIESGKEGQSGNGIPIRASDARTFLQNFKTSAVLPPLISATLSKEPWLEAAAPVPAPTSSEEMAPAPAPSTETTDTTAMFDDVQNLKWQLDMMLNPAKYQAGEMAKRLAALEKRIIRYSLTDTPMPATLASGFREEIMKLKNTFQQ
jgi:hypothetical protein